LRSRASIGAALAEKPLYQRHMAAARRVGKRHGARAIARLQRGARRHQAARQRDAILGGCRRTGVALSSTEAMPGFAR